MFCVDIVLLSVNYPPQICLGFTKFLLGPASHIATFLGNVFIKT
jgi:hypothetical protein